MSMEAVKEIFGYKAHSAYKESGASWLGDVPAHWKAQALGTVLQLKSVKNRPDWPVLSVYREYGVIPKDSRDDNHNATSLDTTNYKAVEPGDLVINKMKAWQGSMGVSNHRGIVSPAYITCSVDRTQVHGPYLHQLLRSHEYVGAYNAISDGVRIGQWDMRYEDLKRLLVLLPPIPEQTLIAAFLDRKCGQIDTAIAQKERLIALLRERRQVLVQQAVTKGLDPQVKMKDSGVAWLGEVPEHWEFVPNRHIFQLMKRLVGKAHGDYTLLSLTLNGVIKRDMENPEGKFPAEFDTYQEVKPGEFVFCLFDVEETPRTVGLAKDHGMITGAYTVMANRSKALSEYLYYYYLSLDSQKALRSIYRGLRNTIPKDVFASIKTPIPPLEEQRAIVDKIEANEAKTNRSIKDLEASIAKLKEYRSILINAAVTGKIKVPEE